MEKYVIIDFGNTTVWFTPEGKISVIDAIIAVSSSDKPWDLWENLKTKNPEILDYCENYSFQSKEPVPVVDTDGWDKIFAALIEQNLMADL